MRVTFFERCGCLTVGALSLLSCVGDGASDTDVFGGSVVQSERTYGFGKPATPDEIAAWDIDAMPDGTGLPEGQGSVAEGALVYEQKCIACHGATGTEGPYNRLVGRVPDDAFPPRRAASDCGVPADRMSPCLGADRPSFSSAWPAAVGLNHPQTRQLRSRRPSPWLCPSRR